MFTQNKHDQLYKHVYAKEPTIPIIVWIDNRSSGDPTKLRVTFIQITAFTESRNRREGWQAWILQ